MPIGAPLHSSYCHPESSHLLDVAANENAANSRLFDSVFMKPRESMEEPVFTPESGGNVSSGGCLFNDLPESLYHVESPSTDSKASDLYDFASDNSFGHLYEDLDFDSEMGVMGGHVTSAITSESL